MKELRQVNRRRMGWWQWISGLGRSSQRNQDPVTDYEVVKGLNITLYEGQCFAIVVSLLTYPDRYFFHGRATCPSASSKLQCAWKSRILKNHSNFGTSLEF